MLTLRAGVLYCGVYTHTHTHVRAHTRAESLVLLIFTACSCGRSREWALVPALTCCYEVCADGSQCEEFFKDFMRFFFFSVKEPRCLTPGKYFWIITIIFVNDFPSTICSALSHLCSLFLTICYLYIAMLFWSQSFPVFSIFTLFRCFILQIWGLLNRLFQAY